jgi:hypothetical protein
LIAAYHAIDNALGDEVEAFFDRVRDPDFKERIDGVGTPISRDILRFEAGIIRQMYLLQKSKDYLVDPQTVIEAISR